MDKYASEVAFWKQLIEKGAIEKSPDGRYLKHMLLPANYLAGKKVLEIGPGPLHWIGDFTDCEFVGLDPLVTEYRKLGYPENAMRYVQGHAEAMPFDDDSFDAVVSFNAIDHVDDFEAACKEIERVCKGLIRIEVHYHEAWPCEPMVLNDERVRAAFSKSVKKLIERPYGDTFFPGHPESPSYTGTVALWSNDPYMDKRQL